MVSRVQPHKLVVGSKECRVLPVEPQTLAGAPTTSAEYQIEAHMCSPTCVEQPGPLRASC